MAERIRITKAEGTWVVRAGGAVIGESGAALELDEEGYPPVIYFPRGDIAMAFLERGPTVTTCPWKGDATHYAIVTKSRSLPDAAWSYEDPKPEMDRIRDHIAFYASEEVTVEQL